MCINIFLKSLFHYNLNSECAYLILGRMKFGFNYFYTNYMFLIYGLVNY